MANTSNRNRKTASAKKQSRSTAATKKASRRRKKNGRAEIPEVGELMQALVSLQAEALYYYTIDTDEKGLATRAGQLIDLIKSFEAQVQSWLGQRVSPGACPPNWIDCNGICIPPGSVCA